MSIRCTQNHANLLFQIVFAIAILVIVATKLSNTFTEGFDIVQGESDGKYNDQCQLAEVGDDANDWLCTWTYIFEGIMIVCSIVVIPINAYYGKRFLKISMFAIGFILSIITAAMLTYYGVSANNQANASRDDIEWRTVVICLSWSELLLWLLSVVDVKWWLDNNPAWL